MQIHEIRVKHLSLSLSLSPPLSTYGTLNPVCFIPQLKYFSHPSALSRNASLVPFLHTVTLCEDGQSFKSAVPIYKIGKFL